MKNLFSSLLIAFCFLSFSSLFSSCDEDDASQDCICTLEYNPVCADGITFSNACAAECEGYTVYINGVCVIDSLPPDNDTTIVVIDTTCVCDDIYNPVCVATPNAFIDYQNPCSAECDGYTNFTFGTCNTEPIDTTGCNCPEIWAPVCVATPSGGLILTFDNACFAECEGYDSNIYYPCNSDTTNVNQCPNGMWGLVVDLTGLDGCGLVIQDAQQQSYEVAILPDGVSMTAGQEIMFEYIPRDDFASICMVGQIIEVTCYEEI